MLAWEWPPRVTGGLGVTAAGLGRALARRGDSVSVLLPAGVASLAAGRRARFETEGVELIPAELVASGSRTALLAGSSYAAIEPAQVDEYVSAAMRVAACEPFDLVHAHDWMSFPAAQAAAQQLGRPWLAHLHSLELDRAGGAGRAASQRIEALEREGLRRATRVVCVSAASAEEARRRYGLEPQRLRVLHGAVEGYEVHGTQGPHATHAAPGTGSPPRAAPGVAGVAGEARVLFLGRFEWQKGPDLFLTAVDVLLCQGIGLRAEMIGAGSLSPGVREFIARRGLGERITCPGAGTPAEARAAIERADLLVMPSRREPFGLVALEAAAAGRCVIVAERAGVRELLPSAPALDCRDASALALLMRHLIEAPEERQRIARALQVEARGHDWDRRARELAAIYAELLP